MCFGGRLRSQLIALIAILLFGVSPFLPVAAAGLIATANGCQLDEGSQRPCAILGHDLGALLYTMGVVGWYGIATVPLAILLLLAWTVWLVVAVVKNGLKERAGKTSSN